MPACEAWGGSMAGGVGKGRGGRFERTRGSYEGRALLHEAHKTM